MNRIASGILVVALGLWYTSFAQGAVVAHWPLDDSAADVAGTYNGTESGGVTFGVAGATALTGSAASFDAGAIDVPFAAELNPESFTVTAWVKPESAAGYQSVVTSRNDIGPGTDLQGFILYNDAGGNWSFWTGDGDPGWPAVAGPPVQVGVWQHMAISYDAATTTKTLYVNGSQVASATDQGYVPNVLRDFHIGAGGDLGTQYYFAGDLDEMWLLNEALSETQIDNLRVLNVLDVDEVTWDGAGDAEWGAFYAPPPDPPHSHWVDAGGPVDWFPDADRMARATINTDTVTVAEDRTAVGLTVGGSAAVQVAAGRTLTVLGNADFAAGSSLGLAGGAAFSAGGGSIAALSTAGDATLSTVGGDVSVAGFNATAAGTFTKAGAGTLVMQDIAAGGATLKVDAGRLDLTGGADPLGGAAGVVLAGGRLTLWTEFDITPGAPDDLTENYYTADNYPNQNLNLDPLGPGQGYLRRTPTLSQLYSAGNGGVSTPLDIDQDPINNLPPSAVDFNARSNGLIPAGDPDYFGAVWHGLLSVGAGLPLEPGQITFGTASDDGTAIWIDGRMVLNSNFYQPRTIRTATVDLSEGDHEIYIGYYEGGGGANVEVKFGQGAGLDYDLDMQFVEPKNPAQAGLWTATSVSEIPLGLGGKTITVDGGGSLEVHGVSASSFGPLRMVAGDLSTTGSVAGIGFDGTTIDPSATAVGFDPQIATDYGTIANDSTQPALTISKVGPGTWVLEDPPGGATGTGNVTWQVTAGTLEVPDETPLGGRPVTLAGGRLEVTGGSGPPGPAAAGALGHWALDDGPGSGSAADSAGGNTGTLMNMDTANAWVAGLIGDYALQFDGSDDYVDLGGGSSLSGPTDLTVSAWIKTDAVTPGVILQQRNGGYNGEYQLMVNGNGTLNFMLYGGGYQYNFATAATVNDGAWHHVVAQRDGPDGRIYIDGVPAASASGPVRNLDATINVGMGADIRDWIRYFNGTMDDVLLYDRALDLPEIAAMAGMITPDMSSTDLTVVADSTLSVGGASSIPFRSLRLQSGVLTVSGVGVDFAATTLDTAADAEVGLDLQAPTQVGPIDVLTPGSVTLAKTGPVDLVLTAANVGAGGIPETVTLAAREGRIVGVHGSNPFDAAALQIDGGEVVLAATADEPQPAEVTFDNPVTVRSSGTLTAGSGGVGRMGAAGVPVVHVGSQDNGLALDAGTVSLRSEDEYTLDVAGPLSGPGDVSVPEGNVVLSGGGSAGALRVSGGRLDVAAEVQVQSLSVTGGVVDTDQSRVVVSDRMVLANTPFTIDQPNTFSVNGSDLGNPDVDRLITLGGGTLEVGASAVPVVGLVSYWSLDDGPGSNTAADLAGGHLGTLVNMDPQTAWVDGQPAVAGDYALAFDGSDDRVDVAYDAALNPDSFTVTAWVRPNSTAGYQSVFTSRHDQGPNVDLRGYILYNDAGGNWSFWTGDGDPGWAGLGGPAVVVDVWQHMAISFDAASGTKALYMDGVEVASSTTQGYVANELRDLHIGGGGDAGNQYYCDGTIDDVLLYSRALAVTEIESLMTSVPGEGLELPNTNLLVTADSTLLLDAISATIGDVTLGAGVRLDITGAEAALQDVSAGHDATISGTIMIEGVLSPGESAGRLNIIGGPEFAETAVYRCEIDRWDSENVADPWNPVPPTGPVNDLVEVSSGDALLAGTLELSAIDKLHPPVQAPGQPPGVMVEWFGDQTRSIVGASGEDSVRYAFENVPQPQPEVYDLPGTGNWGQGHIGHGVFLTRDGDAGQLLPANDRPDPPQPGISYGSVGPTRVHLFQAADGDTNGDRRLGSLDIQAILSANSFPDVQPADWPQGDFTGDGWCNGLDIQAILATGLYPFLPDPYAAVEPGGPPDGTVDLILDPATGELTIDTDQLTINGYVIQSADCIFLPEQGINPGWFTESTACRISGNMGFEISGTHDLGAVINPRWLPPEFDPFAGDDPARTWYHDDLTFTYTVAGAPGTFVGTLIVVPEPGTAAMLFGGLLVLLAWVRRRRRR